MIFAAMRDRLIRRMGGASLFEAVRKSVVDLVGAYAIAVVSEKDRDDGVVTVANAKDAKARIAALSKLGEVDGVDAFKKRSEVTHKVQTLEEVERELIETLNLLEDQVIDVEVREASSGLGDA